MCVGYGNAPIAFNKHELEHNKLRSYDEMCSYALI